MCTFMMEKYSLSPGMLAAVILVTRSALYKYVWGTPFLTLLQSHQPPWYGWCSSHWFCAPSNYVSQSLSVFVVMCRDGFAWNFTYIGQLAAQALHIMCLLVLFEREVPFGDPERLCIEVWDLCICFLKWFLCNLSPVMGQQSLVMVYFCLSPEFWCLTAISGCKEQTMS